MHAGRKRILLGWWPYDVQYVYDGVLGTRSTIATTPIKVYRSWGMDPPILEDTEAVYDPIDCIDGTGHSHWLVIAWHGDNC